MSYIVTARKYRPQVFEDVVGQQHITTTLRNAIASNRLSHAYIFSGGRGSGKTTTARILAKAINCSNQINFNPCNKCEICNEITDGRSLDVIEIDGASNRSVEEVQKIREGVKYNPSRTKYRVYIIDEIHMLTQHAFNALLKTLEEPPSHIVFIFATTEIQKVPTTILSRCQRYDFRRISVDDIVVKLEQIAEAEKVSIDKASLLILAKKADGAMRDAQSLFDQVLSSCGDKVTADQVVLTLNLIDTEMFFKVSEAISHHNASEVLNLIDEIMQRGYDLKEFVSGLLEHFRNMLIINSNASPALLAVSDFYRKKYLEESKTFSEFDILRIIQLLIKLEVSLKYAAQPRFKLEAVFVQLTKLESVKDVSQILAELQELKKKPFPEEVKYNSNVTQNNSPLKNPEPTKIKVETPKLPAKEETQKYFSTEFNIEFLKLKWEEVVSEVRKRKMSTGSILSHVSPLSINGTQLQLECDSEYHSSAVKNYKEFISTILKEMFGVNLKIEPVINTNASVAKPVEDVKVETSQKENEVIEILFSKFGAEPL